MGFNYDMWHCKNIAPRYSTDTSIVGRYRPFLRIGVWFALRTLGCNLISRADGCNQIITSYCNEYSLDLTSVGSSVLLSIENYSSCKEKPDHY